MGERRRSGRPPHLDISNQINQRATSIRPNKESVKVTHHSGASAKDNRSSSGRQAVGLTVRLSSGSGTHRSPNSSIVR